MVTHFKNKYVFSLKIFLKLFSTQFKSYLFTSNLLLDFL